MHIIGSCLNQHSTARDPPRMFQVTDYFGRLPALGTLSNTAHFRKKRRVQFVSQVLCTDYAWSWEVWNQWDHCHCLDLWCLWWADCWMFPDADCAEPGILLDAQPKLTTCPVRLWRRGYLPAGYDLSSIFSLIRPSLDRKAAARNWPFRHPLIVLPFLLPKPPPPLPGHQVPLPFYRQPQPLSSIYSC